MNTQREQCASCLIWTGGKEERLLMEYRDVRICSWCFRLWKGLEKKLGREVGFKELVRGKGVRGKGVKE